MGNELSERLKEIRNEDIIWVIYIGIIILSFYSNNIEKKYFFTKNEDLKKKYKDIIIFIFVILVIVYFYFAYDSYKSVKSLRKTDTKKKCDLTNLSFVASVLVLISGIIFLYIAIEDENIDVELAFN